MVLRSTVIKRVFFGTLMIAVLTGLLLADGWLAGRNYFILNKHFQGFLFALIVLVMGCGGAVELARLARGKDIHVPLWLILPAIIMIVLHPFWHPDRLSDNIYIWGAGLAFLESDGAVVSLAAVLLATLLATALYQGIKFGTEKTLANLGFACLAVVYIGLGCYFLVALRLLGQSESSIWGQSGWLIMFLACVKSADIGGYFTGKYLGRHKWVPSISPTKTWEGFFGGIILAVIVASLFAAFSAIMDSAMAIVLGIVVAVTGQLGDLLESMLKRDGAVKDSGKIVPEFGGFLDLIDSPLVAAPFAYVLFCF